ncbi:MAG: hypothetical protein U0411_06070 [Thermodesulfovibrionales bacterium]
MKGTMKLISLCLLTVAVLSLLAPVVVAHPLPDTGGAASFVVLNVCSSSDSGSAGSLDIPCIHERPCLPALFEAAGGQRSPDSPLHSFLAAFREEHPPRV